MKTLFISSLIAATTLSFSLFSYGQSAPGAVSTGLRLWLRSDASVSTTSGLVDNWEYQNDISKSFSSLGSNRPSLENTSINFNPSISFPGSKFMDGPTLSNAPIAAGDDDYAAIVVWKSDNVSNFQRIWSQRSTGFNTNDAIALSTCPTPTPLFGNEIAPNDGQYCRTVTEPYSLGIWNISAVNLLNSSTNDIQLISDKNISGTITVLNTDPAAVNGPALRNLSDVVNRIGANHDGMQPLNGNIAEIIVYNTSLNSGNFNNIFSYLAMKYGITIKTNLINSTGAVVWDATANSVYNNTVFGLARDNGVNGSALLVSQSNSNVSGSGNGTGQSGMGNIVLSNPSSLDDLDFLQIGNDNAALTESSSADMPAIGLNVKRLTREWKVQETGDVGTTTLTMNFTGITVSGTSVSHFKLMIDVDGNGDFTNGSKRYYTAASYVGGIATFANVTLNNNEVFTFVTEQTTLPVTWINFSASTQNKDVLLEWKVENNAEASHYEIEHSTDAVNYEKIQHVINNPSVKTYQHLNKSVSSGKHFFRIRQVDFDGAYNYSKIVSADLTGGALICKLLNVPIHSASTYLLLSSSQSGIANLQILSIAGVTLQQEQRVVNSGTNSIPINMKQLKSGIYLLKINLKNESKTIRFTKL